MNESQRKLTAQGVWIGSMVIGAVAFAYLKGVASSSRNNLFGWIDDYAVDPAALQALTIALPCWFLGLGISAGMSLQKWILKAESDRTLEAGDPPKPGEGPS